jgi:hypothetical protein
MTSSYINGQIVSENGVTGLDNLVGKDPKCSYTPYGINAVRYIDNMFIRFNETKLVNRTIATGLPRNSPYALNITEVDRSIQAFQSKINRNYDTTLNQGPSQIVCVNGNRDNTYRAASKFGLVTSASNCTTNSTYGITVNGDVNGFSPPISPKGSTGWSFNGTNLYYNFFNLTNMKLYGASTLEFNVPTDSLVIINVNTPDLKMINSFHLNVVKLNGLPTNVSVPIAQK